MSRTLIASPVLAEIMNSSDALASRQPWLISTHGGEILQLLPSPSGWLLIYAKAKRNAQAEYLDAHIPGAVFFDIDKIADHSSDLPHMLPRPEAFSSAMRALGIGDGQSIVVYDGLGLYSAPRVWWTFRTFGVREVFILDGGFPKWKAERRPTNPLVNARAPFTARLYQARCQLAHCSTPCGRIGQVGCALAAFPSKRRNAAGLRSGHIPARSICITVSHRDGRCRA